MSGRRRTEQELPARMDPRKVDEVTVTLDRDRVTLDLVEQHGERPAVCRFLKAGEESWSAAELGRTARCVAAGFQHRGFLRGERVAICAENSPRWIAAALGTMAAGGVVVPIDAQLEESALAHVLADAEPALILMGGSQLERTTGMDTRGERIAIEDGEGQGEQGGWPELLADSPAANDQLPAVEPADNATLFYTSGTTSMPKGVPLKHRHLAHQMRHALGAKVVEPKDGVLLPLPLHHVYPFVIGMLAPMVIGVPLTLPYAMTGPQIVRAIREGGVTAVAGVPRLYRALLEGIHSRAAASW